MNFEEANTDNCLYDAELYYQQYVNCLYHVDPLNDLSFWEGIAKENHGNVLELGSGYGRILSLFQKSASNVIMGIDANLSMINFGKTKYPDLDLIYGDMCDFSLEKRFDLIFLGFNSFLHILNFEDLQKCLSCIKSHLSEKGKLIIANTNMSTSMLKGLAEDAGDFHSEKFLSVFNCPRTSELIVESRTRNYEPAKQRLTIDLKYHYLESKKEEIHQLVAKLYFPLELQFLLQSFGLRLDSIWGDYERGDHSSDSPEHITVWSLAC